MFVLVIELILIALTYIVSDSWLTVGVASVLTAVSYMLCIDDNPFRKALNVFYVACTVSLIYLFGIYAKTLAKTIPDGCLVEMKNALLELGSIFIAGATPPFNITGDGALDLTIFIFGFAILEAVLKLINHFLKHR